METNVNQYSEEDTEGNYEKPHVCENCNRVFDSETLGGNHCQKCSEKKPLVCDVGDEIMKEENDASADPIPNSVKYSEEKTFMFDKCNRGFHSEGSLPDHCATCNEADTPSQEEYTASELLKYIDNIL
jgi:hypothetical protein